MSTNTESTAIQAESTQVTFIMPSTEVLGELDNKESIFSLSMKYKTADDWAALKDQPIRAYYMGTKHIPNDKGELVKCGIFVAKKEVFISAPILLIEAVDQLDPKTPICITYRGKKTNKNSEGATMQFDVDILG